MARSNEAKALGVKEGMPYFQMEQQFPNAKIAVFSSNYELYGELTSRVVSIISKEAPAYFRYSIDECFVYLDGIQHGTLQHWGEHLHQRIWKSVGMPVSIGLAPNKTLAKIAAKLAKKFEVYRHCCLIDNDANRIAALKWLPVEDVWGIGRRYAAKLQALGCRTAYDFAIHHKDWVRMTFNNINILRTWQELNGEDVVPNEQLTKKKSICTSRSFNGMIADLDTLNTHVSNYASRCAEKLRKQGTVATVVGVFLSTIHIVKAAKEVLKGIYHQGYLYKRAGVIVLGITPDSPLQQDLFDLDAEHIQKFRQLDKVVDRINKRYGTETIVIGSQQYTRPNGEGKANIFANAIKHDFKSPNPTTRWSDIIRLK